MQPIAEHIYHWIDLIWLPITWYVIDKKHRMKALAFVAACILTLRTQVELMEAINKPTGIITLLDSHIFSRGLIVYGAIIMIFLILAHFSKASQNIIFFTAALSIYILSFCISMLVMVL